MPRLSVTYWSCGFGIAHHQIGNVIHASTSAVAVSAISVIVKPAIELTTSHPASFHVCGSVVTVLSRSRNPG